VKTSQLVLDEACDALQVRPPSGWSDPCSTHDSNREAKTGGQKEPTELTPIRSSERPEGHRRQTRKDPYCHEPPSRPSPLMTMMLMSQLTEALVHKQKRSGG
jgi:hypothetical protein